MRLAVLPLASALLASFGPPSRAEAPPPIPIGVAVTDITPEYPIRMTGYSSRAKESEGIASRLKARALAMGADDAEGGPTVLLSVDTLGVGSKITEEVAARLKTRKKVARERLVICATHTHCGPTLTTTPKAILGVDLPADQQGRIERYSAELTDALERVALAALEARAPGRLAWGRGSVGFAGNRRLLKEGRWIGFSHNTNGPVDHALPLLRVTDPEGKPRAVLFGYACHCTTLPGEFNQICGDWAGFACEAIERDHPGVVALATIGCGADSGPQPTGTLDLARRHGEALAAEVGRLLNAPLKPLVGPPSARSRSIELPLEAPPGREELERRAKLPASEGYVARQFLRRLDAGEPLARSIPYPVTTWCFGDDLAMVFLGGEVVLDYNLRIRWETDANRLWVTAYTDDVSCYVSSRRVLAEGGYEPDFSMVLYGQPARLAPAVEDLVVRTVHDLLPPPYEGPRAP